VRRWNISARQRHTAANGRDYSSDRSPPVGRAKTIAILELIYANEDATWTTTLTAPAAELDLPVETLAEPMAREANGRYQSASDRAGEGDRWMQNCHNFSCTLRLHVRA
jgi:hypothetical protein